MLLHVLNTLNGSERKRTVGACIRMWDLFAFADEDATPYPSVFEKGGIEPRWMTLVAFARFDCVERDWMEEKGRDQWKISAKGKRIFADLMARGAGGDVDVRHGYLWTEKFKRILAQRYSPSEADAKRPWGSIYDDTKYSAILHTFDR